MYLPKNTVRKMLFLRTLTERPAQEFPRFTKFGFAETKLA
jgi:hypothetical protein